MTFWDDLIICPNCKSRRIFKLRIDSDWGGFIGVYSPVNEENYYTEKDLRMDNYDRPDVNVYHCLDCDRMWEDEDY